MWYIYIYFVTLIPHAADVATFKLNIYVIPARIIFSLNFACICIIYNIVVRNSGSFASNETSGDAYNVVRMHLHGECFVSGGDRTLKIWRIDAEKRKVHGLDVGVGKLKRLINCIAVDYKDEIIYCGTSSGDIIKARSEAI